MPQHFENNQSLHEKILFVLALMQKGSAEEIAGEIAELEGIASECRYVRP